MTINEFKKKLKEINPELDLDEETGEIWRVSTNDGFELVHRIGLKSDFNFAPLNSSECQALMNLMVISKVDDKGLSAFDDVEPIDIKEELGEINPDLTITPNGKEIQLNTYGGQSYIVYYLDKEKIDLHGWGALTNEEQSKLYRLLIDHHLAKKPFDDLTNDKIQKATSDNPFKDYTDKLAATLKEKNDAYGDSFAKSVDNFGLAVIPVRLSDKFNRICELIKHNKLKENDESLQDTLLDMAGYSILALKYLKEHEDD